jgi:small subunit ribosomal protein S17
MADEEKNETTEETEAEAPAEPPAAEETPAEEPAADEAPAEEAPVEESAAEEPVADDVPAEEPAAAEAPVEAPAAAAPAEEAEPQEVLSPKQRRKRERATFTGEAAPTRSAEERAAEREQRRRAQATSRRNRRQRARGAREAGTGTPPADREPGSKKVRQGTVLSSKADKTITVRIEVVRRHPVYEKVVRRSATIHAHDERNDANEGDTVRVIESRPLSRTKRWRLVEVLERAR